MISYASRSLTAVETRYSHTRVRVRMRYLIGAEFDLITDHAPLQILFGNARAKLPARIERWGLRLMAFKYRVLHVRGEDNISDYLSRHPVRSTHDDRLCHITEEYINNVIYHATPKAISLDNIRAETRSDATLQKVLTALQTGDWREAENDKHMWSYYNVRPS